MSVSKTKKKFAFDIGWVLTGLVIALVIRLLRRIVLARYLGPADLGLFSMCLTIGSIITLVAGFGLENAVVKYSAECKKDKNKLSQLVSSAFITMIIFGTISFILLFTFSDTLANIFNMPSLSLLLKIFAVVFPFTLIISIVFGLFNGLREMNYHSYANISRASLAFIFIIIFILTGFGVSGVVLGYVLAEIAIACIFIVFIRKYIHFTVRAYKQTTKKLTSFGSKILSADAINMINYEADILLIGYFLTATDVGYYAIAVTLSRFFWLVPNAIQKVTYPATSEYWSTNNHSALQKMIDKSMKHSACILIGVGLLVGFFARDVITLIFGVEFIYAVSPLLILLFGTVINGATSRAIGGSLAAVGRPDLDMKKSGVSATVNVILNILLIPRFGISGAAIATTISLLISMVLDIILIVRTLKVKIDFKWYIKAFGTGFMLILVFIKLSWLNYYLVGGIILCAYIIVTTVFLLTNEDRETLKSMLYSFYPSSHKKN